MRRRIDSGESTSDDVDDITDDAGEEAAVELLIVPSQRISFIDLYTQCSRQQLASFSQNAERASIHITNAHIYQSSDDATNTMRILGKTCSTYPRPLLGRNCTMAPLNHSYACAYGNNGPGTDSYISHVSIVQFN